MKVGDKLLDSIESGMNNSDAGILLISPDYLRKKWTNYEMDVLIRQSIETEMKILPLWHNVSKADVEKRHLGLSGIVALNTSIGFTILIDKLTSVLSCYAPTIGSIPCYESAAFRFLRGRGEITIGKQQSATTLWEFLIYAKDSWYPLFIEGKHYTKKNLLFEAAQLLPHISDDVRKCVKEEGYQKIWNMCVDAGYDPEQF